MEDRASRETVVAVGGCALDELQRRNGAPGHVMGAGNIMTGEKADLIVVVEDETIVLMGYRMLFESWGYRVVAGTSLDEAMEQLQEVDDTPSIIVADYRLKHGQTGVGAIRVIQSTYGDQIPAILITGDTAVDRLREAAGSGLPILHKPVNGPALQKLTSEILAIG